MNNNIESTPIVSNAEKSIISKLFLQQDLGRGFNPLADNYSPLFENIFKYCFDPGLRQENVSQNPEISVQPAGPVAMLTRTGAIHFAEINGPENFDYHNFDIKGMRDADKAGCADWLLNKIAQAIQVTVDNNALCSRYGGDEFMLMTKKGTPDLEGLIAKVKQAVEGVSGYFVNPEDNKLEQKNVEIKDQKVETISPPSTDIDLKIFKVLLSRGIVLNQSEIDKIKNKPEFNKNNRFDEVALSEYLSKNYWNENNLYDNKDQEKGSIVGLSTEATINNKMAFISQNYPEFRQALAVCQALDLEDVSSTKGTLVNTSAVIKFIENVIFDRRLGDVFYSFSHLADGVKSQKYSELISIDTKFLKEINDDISYMDGDELIAGCWNKIQETLGKQRKSFEISRRGGTFVLALKQGEVMDPNLRHKISNIINFDYELEGEAVKIPVGVASQTIDYSTKLKEKDWLTKQLAVIEASSEDWYRKIAINSTSEPMGKLKLLIDKYFNNPKRTQERQKMLAKVRNSTPLYIN